MKGLFKRFRLLAVVTALIISGLWALTLTRPAGVKAQDCDDNAVIKCGITAATLAQKCQENQGGNVQAVFKEFGITDCGAALSGLVPGQVGSDNKVYLVCAANQPDCDNNKPVATDAVTAGRQNMAGSTPILGGAFFKRPPSVSFASPGRPSALIRMDSGVFKFAIIESCGNPVNATPVMPTSPPQQPVQPTASPQTPDFTIVKDVRIKGQPDWTQDVTANQGDHLQYHISIKNTGQVTLGDVMVHDTLPSGVSLADNSLMVNGQAKTGDIRSGINIGTLNPGEQVEIIFDVSIGQDTVACNDQRLNNVAFAKPTTPQNMPEKQDNATAQVCKPNQPSSPPPTQTVVKQQVSTKIVAVSLPNTGPGGIIGAFAGTSVVGTLGYEVFSRRRLHKSC